MRASRVFPPVAGLAVGLLLGLALGSLTATRAGEAVRAAGPDRGDRAGPPRTARAPLETASPGAAAAASGPAAPVAAPVAASMERRPAGVPEQAIALGGPLAKHLRRLLDEGLLERHFLEYPEGWEWLAMEVYLSTGHPEYALELFRERGLDDGYGPRIAELFANSGRPALAAEALAETLERASWRQDVAARLAELDPGRAVAVLREALDAQDPPGLPATRMCLAEVLARSGGRAEAMAIVVDLLERDEADEQTWDLLDLLAELDPSDMERRLKLALDRDAGSTWHRERLAGLLLEQGRVEEARAALDLLLADGAGTPGARRMLLELDREQGVAFLERAARDTQDAGLWSELGDLRLEEGDDRGAVEAWMNAFRRHPGDNPWCRRLEEHAFDRLLGEFEGIVRASENDELWGDLGDTYRRAGRLEDALACYDRAHAIDPGDSEWTSKRAQLRGELGLAD